MLTHIKTFPIGVSPVSQTIKMDSYFNNFMFYLVISFTFTFLVCLLLIQATVHFFSIGNLQGK